MKRVLPAVLICLVLPVFAHATPYIPVDEAMKMPGREDSALLGATIPSTFDYGYDPLNRLNMCADFIVTMQVSDTSAAGYGGMREGEHMLGVIQTDNTSESIWIWTRYFSLTGDTSYHDNVEAAWTYCMNYPAYNEEGESDLVTGYYRVYNCSWALRAVMEYEQVYGDNTYSAYGDSCASYLCHNPLMLRFPTGMFRRLNGLVMGWAVGNLYEYGQYVSNPIFASKAVDMSDSLKDWVEVNPNKLHWKEWAMGGGAVMWGLAASYFQEHPADLFTWTDTYASYLDAEVDSSEYQNAWRGWAALGQFAAFEATGDSEYEGYFKHLADTLVLNDGDSDGGIPVIDAQPDSMDQSWVTNYLGYMCLAKMVERAGVEPEPMALRGLKVSPSPMPSDRLPSLRFVLHEPSRVLVRVFDVAGRAVATHDAGRLEAGPQIVSLDAAADRVVAPGVYFYELRSGRRVASGKMVVLK